MKKTVVLEFPDNFEFPENYQPEKCNSWSANHACQFYQSSDYWAWCMLTNDNDYTPEDSKKPCPFYGGADKVNL